MQKTSWISLPYNTEKEIHIYACMTTKFALSSTSPLITCYSSLESFRSLELVHFIHKKQALTLTFPMKSKDADWAMIWHESSFWRHNERRPLSQIAWLNAIQNHSAQFPMYFNAIGAPSRMLKNCDKIMHLHFSFDACPMHSPFGFMHLRHQNLSKRALFCHSLQK